MAIRREYIGSGKKFVRYSPEEMAEARRTDMIDFLSRKEGFTFNKVGSVYQCREHDSLIVQGDRQRWYWNSKNLRGLNCIDWLMKIDGYNVQEAFEKIIDLSGNIQTQFVKAPVVKEEPKEFSLPERNKVQKNAAAYLTKTRMIDPHIVNYCLKNGYIYQDNYNNVVFVGYDTENNAKFAESKLTNTFQKRKPRNISGSQKEYSFNLTYLTPESNRDTVYVFEAPVDLLSHATMYAISERNRAERLGENPDKDIWKKQNRLSLSGTSDVALAAYLERFPEITNIVLCLDNDEAGRNGVAKINEKYADRYNISVHVPKFGKDYNETLVQYTAASINIRKAAEKTEENNEYLVVENKKQRSR